VEKSPQVSVRLAHGMDDMMMGFAVRASVFMVEQAYSYFDDFDGNDMCASHFIGFVDDEPAATLRVRTFGSFAKIERMAVRKEFRNTHVASRTVEAAVNHLARKGVPRIYGHASDGREKFWKYTMRKFGKVEGVPGVGPFSMGGHDYHVFVLTLPSRPDALDIDSDPVVVNRAEGAWNVPGRNEATGVML
jgi:predicted GNAT family N-acyltransferase